MFKISDESCNRVKKQFCICVLVVFPNWAMVFYGVFFCCDWNLPRVLFGNYMILWLKVTISVNCSEMNLFSQKPFLTTSLIDIVKSLSICWFMYNRQRGWLLFFPWFQKEKNKYICFSLLCVSLYFFREDNWKSSL